MRINKDKSTYQPPYSVVLLDATDAYYYADVMDNMQEVAKLDDYQKSVALADAIFVTKNYQWESLQAMNHLDAGYDVRVYDSTFSCVYAAHTRYEKNWIGVNESSPLFSPRIQKAIRFSTKTHEVYQKQKRKGKDIPYITHPLIVGLILARADAEEDVVTAGILHDTMEDSTPEKKVTKEMLTERFGSRVAELVDSVTEQDKSLSWEERKRVALEHISSFSNDSLLVKSADIISNAFELVEDFNSEGDVVFTRFNAPRENVLKHYLSAIATIRKQWPENPLVKDLAEVEIQVSRILALGQGDLSYAGWSISFIEYEMRRAFLASKYKGDIMALCSDFHAAMRRYESTGDVTEFDRNTRVVADGFHKIIKALDGDEQEQMVQFLLTSHIADTLSSLNRYMAQRP